MKYKSFFIISSISVFISACASERFGAREIPNPYAQQQPQQQQAPANRFPSPYNQQSTQPQQGFGTQPQQNTFGSQPAYQQNQNSFNNQPSNFGAQQQPNQQSQFNNQSANSGYYGGAWQSNQNNAGNLTGAEDISNQTIAGNWQVRGSAGNCFLRLTGTAAGGGFLVASPDASCPPQIAAIRSWALIGTELLLRNQNGQALAQLQARSINQFSGRLDGLAIELVR